ncbi:hypothetical protein HDV02_003519, partial [Globomyces sp. JEL0801]
FDEADEILRMGIHKKASPIDELLLYYQQFLDRKNRFEKDQSSIDHSDSSLSNLTQPLSTVTSHTSHHQSHHTSNKPIQQHYSTNHPNPSKRVNQKKIKVFHDDTTPTTNLFPDSDTNHWDDLDLQEAKKENVMDREKWVGVTLPQQSVAVVGPKLSVYADTPSPPPQVKHKTKTVLKQTKNEKLSLFEDDIQSKSKLKVDLSLCCVGGKEYCFEEVQMKCRNLSLTTQSEKSNDVQFSPIRKPNKVYNSPTINTKDAMRDIHDMFDQPLHDEMGLGQIGTSIEDDVVYYNPADDETISSKVFKRPIVGIGVYKDTDDVTQNRSQTFELFNDNPSQIFNTSELFHDDDNNITHDSHQELTNPFISHITSTPMVMKDIVGQPVHIMTPITELDSVSYNHPSMISRHDTIHEESMDVSLLLDQDPGFPNPCNPSDPSIRAMILSNLVPPHIPSVSIQLTTTSSILSQIQPQSRIEYQNRILDIIQIIPTFSKSNQLVLVSDQTTKTILKIQSCASVWEFYILHCLHTTSQTNIIKPISFTLYKNVSVLELEYVQGPTLMDILEKSLEVQQVHDKGFIHGDLRLDNFIVPLNDMKRLVLVDWVAAISLNSFPKHQTFQLPVPEVIDPNECWEFQQGLPWIYQPDWYGIATMLHILIFKTMIVPVGQPPLRTIANTIPTHLNQGLWKKCFEMLLNLTHDDGRLDDVFELVDGLVKGFEYRDEFQDKYRRFIQISMK